jgi:toluene monooxygenase system ferredoxin subunit
MIEAVAKLGNPGIVEVLEQAPPFSTLTRAQRSRIAQISELVDYPSQCDMYRLGDDADCVYVLVRGVVRFKLELGDRSTPAGDVIRSGEFFGWAAMVRGGTRRRVGTASCVTACSVLAIHGDKLLQLMDQDNAIGYAVMTHVNVLVTSTLTALAAG